MESWLVFSLIFTFVLIPFSFVSFGFASSFVLSLLSPEFTSRYSISPFLIACATPALIFYQCASVHISDVLAHGAYSGHILFAAFSTVLITLLSSLLVPGAYWLLRLTDSEVAPVALESHYLP